MNLNNKDFHRLFEVPPFRNNFWCFDEHIAMLLELTLHSIPYGLKIGRKIRGNQS